jgi:hypothetical protein
MAADSVPARVPDLQMKTQKSAVIVSTAAKAEVEVSVSSYPLAMTLRVYKTKIKPKEFLGCQISLKNIGKQELRIADWMFTEPSYEHLVEQADFKHGIYFEVMKAGQVLRTFDCDHSKLWPDHIHNGDRPPLTKRSAAMMKLIQQGVAPEKLDDRLEEMGYPRPKAPEPVLHKLQPGGVLVAKPSPAMIEQRTREGALLGNPEDFFDLSAYCLSVPGKTKMRLVYDYSRLAKLFRQHKKPVPADILRMETPWVDIEVVP